MKRQFCFARVAVTCCRFACGACLITLMALQRPGIAAAQTVVRGPYLAIGTPSSVVVRWRTDVATNSRVQCGPAPGNLTMVVDDADTTTEHIAEITGLLPETRYYYSVGTDTGVGNRRFGLTRRGRSSCEGRVPLPPRLGANRRVAHARGQRLRERHRR